MIGILNRWRQFGRRYFWPHLLLGMVAASLGVSTNLSQTELASVPNASSSVNRLNIGSTGLTNLALLQAHRRPAFGVDYWQQHALRTVIRHLSFALAPQVVYTVTPEVVADEAEPLHIQQLALLVTLNSLLTHEPKPPVIIRQTKQPLILSTHQHQPGLWLAQVQGIRAGPTSLS
ncbi:MAG: secA translation cis-regulator SecM [Ewingella americana]|nr:secA translation cis-regulator SecM [Ewingella americana]KAA8728018.1 secA regulator SecM [Ewingella americana]MCI1680230.1 secA translation cis-regulator SecM [Ewingella americana]MCI1855225.1 secA translation cis-regulator SecM [Ewingella americana]MCI1863702.1 secA translation cis-regulator SecM [Ewingella americana]MCI2142011.1 secA translation cis-regulator SecM [Ewingella americana]